MKYIPKNNDRGISTLIYLCITTFGAGLQWGIGAGVFTAGLLFIILNAIDEALERITLTTRNEEYK